MSNLQIGLILLAGIGGAFVLLQLVMCLAAANIGGAVMRGAESQPRK